MFRILCFFILIAYLESCDKIESQAKCSWFPIASGQGVTYSKCEVGSNIPPYPCSDIVTGNTDSSMYLDNMVFTVSDCTAQKIFYKSGFITGILLIDGTLSSSVQIIAQESFNGRIYTVRQYKDASNYIYSTLTNDSDGMDIIRTKFGPTTGFYQIDYIGNSSGTITNSYNLK